MNTIFGCILLAIVCYLFAKLLLQGIAVEKEEHKEELEIWKALNYNNDRCNTKRIKNPWRLSDGKHVF